MYRLIISIESDDEALQRAALKAAIEAVEDVNNAPVYRAYLETIEGGRIVALPNGHAADPSLAIDATPVSTDISDRNERQLVHETGDAHYSATRTLGDAIVDFVGRSSAPIPLRRIIDEFSTWSEPTITDAVLNLADQRRLNREEDDRFTFTLGSKT